MGWAGLVTRVGPEMPLQQSEKGMGSYSRRKACDLSNRTSVLTREWGKVRAAVGLHPLTWAAIGGCWAGDHESKAGKTRLVLMRKTGDFYSCLGGRSGCPELKDRHGSWELERGKNSRVLPKEGSWEANGRVSMGTLLTLPLGSWPHWPYSRILVIPTSSWDDRGRSGNVGVGTH